MVELRTLTPVGEPLLHYHLPVCRSPARWVWDLIECTLPRITLLAAALSLDVDYLLGRFQSLSGVVQLLVVILVFL